MKIFNISGVFGAIPKNIRLEACSMCQLKCPICSTGSGKNKDSVIGWGYLKFENFRKLIEQNPQIERIELSNWGEIFLNPELGEIVKYAYFNKVFLKAGNGVNLNRIDDKLIEDIVKYKFGYISVSIDGASNDIYKTYRIGGDYAAVIDNINKINWLKKKYNTKYPVLSWQFVVFGHNEHELPTARKKAESLSMEFKTKLNWDDSFSPVRDKDFVRSEGGLNAATREEYKLKYKAEYKTPCLQLWKEPQINWDGKLLGCCVNRFSDFGNVFEQGLRKALRNEKFVYVKKMLRGKAEEREGLPCYYCGIFKNRKGSKMFSDINIKNYNYR